jgi:hypothetical protein
VGSRNPTLRNIVSGSCEQPMMRFAYHHGVAGWLSGEELRIGLGCMRVEPALLQPTVAAALAAGITVFDTSKTGL